MLNLPDRQMITAAREIVQICLEEIAVEGRLQEVVDRPDDFNGQIAIGILADCLRSHQFKLEMIERWTMETLASLLHARGRCACGHVLRSDREYVELCCMECRMLLIGSILPVEQSEKMAQEMIPDVQVRVAYPTSEHQTYLNADGRIVDVRDFDEHHFCQVALDDQREAIWFDAHELTID